MENIKVISIAKEPEKYGPDKTSVENKNLHLSIEVREDKLLACLLDKDTSQYLTWASFNRGGKNEDPKRQLETILKEEILNNKYASSSVVFTRNNAMLIPSAFFSKESLREYLEPQNLIRQDETPCSDFIKNNDCYSVYAVNTSDFSLIKERLPQAVFRHHSSIFIEYLLALHKGNNRAEVHIYVFNGIMDVVALQRGKLLLYNRYSFQTPNDFSYFVLWVYEQLRLNPDDSPCFFYGEIGEKSELFTMSWRYLKNVRLADRITRFSFSNMLENISPHRYYSLFMQYLCI